MEDLYTEVEEYILWDTPETVRKDCDFIQGLVRDPKDLLLDLGCGTGRHSIELARRGYSVSGIDRSAERIGFAKDKAGELGLASRARFEVQDLESLSVKGPYDLAFSLFNTFLMFVDNGTLIRVMNGLHRALKPGGLLVLEIGSLWGSVARGKFRDDEYSFDDVRGDLVRKRTGRIRLCRSNNVYEHTTSRRFVKDGVEYPEKTEVILKRIYSINEVDLLCRLTGFSLDSVFGQMDPGSRIADPYAVDDPDRGDGYVFVLRKSIPV